MPGKVDLPSARAMPTLEEMQRWTGMIGEAQQLLMEAMAERQGKAMPLALTAPPPAVPDPRKLADIQADFWRDSLALWQRFLDTPKAPPPPAPVAAAERDRRFASPQWRDNPFFDLIRQSYLTLADHLVKGVDALEGVDEKQREQIRFATRTLTDAMSPANFPFTNPQVMERTIETGGANLVKGLEHMLADLKKGQLTQSAPDAFVLGRDLAATPGKVIHETRLYQLIQYAPATESVYRTPLIIFPPWINRFYILDLRPEKSFVRWAVEQGLTVFMVSWKSADESLADVTMEDYVLNGQLDAIDTVRALLDVESVHMIGYCVAGTNLAALLAWLAAKGEAGKAASATFFTAQVDFSKAGDLNLFVDDDQLQLIETLAADTGYLDGRYMAATFNLLRGRDLIWSYVVNNYLLGEDYAPFDLLHWNSDVTNLPAGWHRDYLRDLYRDNKLVQPGALSLAGVPIDLTKVKTPAYIQAGREDHIAPAESVWKLTEHFSGPTRFVLAGSGHIAGVVNPPSSGKYQYWTTAAPQPSLAAFIDAATETKGSWWPDWIGWIDRLTPKRVPAKGARKPGKGRLKAIEDAPGRYVRMR